MSPILWTVAIAACAGLMLGVLACRKPPEGRPNSVFPPILLIIALTIVSGTLAFIVGQSALTAATSPIYDATITDSDTFVRYSEDEDGNETSTTMSRAYYTIQTPEGEVVVPSASASSTSPVIGRVIKIAYDGQNVVELTKTTLLIMALAALLGFVPGYIVVTIARAGNATHPNQLGRVVTDAVFFFLGPGILCLIMGALTIMLLYTFEDRRITGIGPFGVIIICAALAGLSWVMFKFIPFLLKSWKNDKM